MPPAQVMGDSLSNARSTSTGRAPVCTDRAIATPPGAVCAGERSPAGTQSRLALTSLSAVTAKRLPHRRPELGQAGHLILILAVVAEAGKARGQSLLG